MDGRSTRDTRCLITPVVEFARPRPMQLSLTVVVPCTGSRRFIVTEDASSSRMASFRRTEFRLTVLLEKMGPWSSDCDVDLVMSVRLAE